MIHKKTLASFSQLLVLSILITNLGIQNAAAQNDDSASSQLGVVSTIDVEVNKVPLFHEISEKMVQARAEANLGPEFAYGMYMSNWDYLIFSPIASMAELDDENRTSRAIQGTPGEDIMESITMEGLHANLTGEIVKRLPEWSYIPEGEASELASYLEIQEHWVLPASYNSEEYKAVITEIIDFFAEIDYPIRVDAYRYQMGEARYAFVFNYNDRGVYHSEYSPKTLLSEYPEFQEVVNRMTSHLFDFTVREWTFLPHLSFMPEE